MLTYDLVPYHFHLKDPNKGENLIGVHLLRKRQEEEVIKLIVQAIPPFSIWMCVVKVTNMGPFFE